VSEACGRIVIVYPLEAVKIIVYEGGKLFEVARFICGTMEIFGDMG
jgi:hypothetical protein